MFRPGHRAGVFIWKNFHPDYRDLGRKLGNRASPAPHMNTSIFLRRKEWRGEISETEPARLTAGAHMKMTLLVLKTNDGLLGLPRRPVNL